MTPILEINAVSKSFGGVNALDNLSLGIEEGKITGLIGPNGAGKTTLFNVITGFLAPDSGEVYFRKQRISGLPPDAIARKGIARSFQHLRLFYEMSVIENVLVALPDHPEECVWRVLTFKGRGFEKRARERALDGSSRIRKAKNPCSDASFKRDARYEFWLHEGFHPYVP